MPKTLSILILASMVLMAAQTAVAKNPGQKFILSLGPGIAAFTMGDMNEMIAANQSGLMNVSPIETLRTLCLGMDLDSSLQYAVTDFFFVGVDVRYLSLYTTAKLAALPVTPPQDEYYTISLPAFEAGLFVKAAIPLSDSLLLTLGPGISYLALSGAGERRESRGRLTGLVYAIDTIPYSGHTHSLNFSLGLDWFVWEWFSLGVEGGCRLAVMDNVYAKQNGSWNLIQKEDGSHFSLDYSGAYLRYVFRLYL